MSARLSLVVGVDSIADANADAVSHAHADGDVYIDNDDDDTQIQIYFSEVKKSKLWRDQIWVTTNWA